MPLPADVRASIVDAYRRGEPVGQIVSAHRIGRATLYRVLRDGGVEPGRGYSGRAKEWTPDELARVRELRAAGLSAGVIAAQIGTCPDLARRALGQLGLSGRLPQRGPDRTVWADGTVMVRVAADDPLRAMANADGFVQEHRLVAARLLGRPLVRREQVTHRNGDRSDNRLANLEVRTNRC